MTFQWMSSAALTTSQQIERATRATTIQQQGEGPPPLRWWQRREGRFRSGEDPPEGCGGLDAVWRACGFLVSWCLAPLIGPEMWLHGAFGPIWAFEPAHWTSAPPAAWRSNGWTCCPVSPSVVSACAWIRGLGGNAQVEMARGRWRTSLRQNNFAIHSSREPRAPRSRRGTVRASLILYPTCLVFQGGRSLVSCLSPGLRWRPYTAGMPTRSLPNGEGIQKTNLPRAFLRNVTVVTNPKGVDGCKLVERMTTVSRQGLYEKWTWVDGTVSPSSLRTGIKHSRCWWLHLSRWWCDMSS